MYFSQSIFEKFKFFYDSHFLSKYREDISFLRTLLTEKSQKLMFRNSEIREYEALISNINNLSESKYGKFVRAEKCEKNFYHIISADEKSQHIYISSSVIQRKELTFIYEVYPDKKSSRILDIQICEDDCDNKLGTMAMKVFLEKMEKLDIETVTGSLSNIDYKNNLKRRIHFYEKFGFLVNINHKTKTGNIILNVDDYIKIRNNE